MCVYASVKFIHLSCRSRLVNILYHIAGWTDCSTSQLPELVAADYLFVYYIFEPFVKALSSSPQDERTRRVQNASRRVRRSICQSKSQTCDYGPDTHPRAGVNMMANFAQQTRFQLSRHLESIVWTGERLYLDIKSMRVSAMSLRKRDAARWLCVTTGAAEYLTEYCNMVP